MRTTPLPALLAALALTGCATTPEAQPVAASPWEGSSQARIVAALERAAVHERACQHRRKTGTRVARMICETPAELALRQDIHHRLVVESLRPIYR